MQTPTVAAISVWFTPVVQLIITAGIPAIVGMLLRNNGDTKAIRQALYGTPNQAPGQTGDAGLFGRVTCIEQDMESLKNNFAALDAIIRENMPEANRRKSHRIQ